MVNDPIADLLTRIRNAQRAGHKSARVPAFKIGEAILGVLKREGFLSFVERKTNDRGFDEFEVGLKYFSTGEPVIGSAERRSKPGRRLYVRADDLPKMHCGLGLSIISTNQGVMGDREARKRKIGGEVIASFQ